MTDPTADRRLSALSTAVELTLQTRDVMPSTGRRLGFFRMPEDSHQGLFPPIHRQMCGAVADFPQDGGRGELETRLTDLDAEARGRQDENTQATLASILRYGLVNEVNIGYLVGPVLPSSALTEIARFSVRNTWIGVVAGPLEPPVVAIVDDLPPGLAERSRLGFAFGPSHSIVFDPDTALVVNDFVVSRGHNERETPVTLRFDPRVGAVDLTAQSSDDEFVPMSAVCPPVEDALSTGASSIRGPDDEEIHAWVPFLYRTLDESAPAISQELLGLTRERQDAQFLALRLRERYERSVQSRPREQLYLDMATDELASRGCVPRQLASPVFLPDSVLTPPELDYRALERVLANLQDIIAEEGGDSPLGQVLKLQWDDISRREDAIVPEVRSSRRRLEHLVQDEEDHQVHYLFHARLTTFSPDSDEIKRSLVRQATLLKVLNSLSDLPIELTYRLFTAPSQAGELGARFEIEATVTGCDAAEASELRESFGEMVHAAFVGAYGLTFVFSRPQRSIDDEMRLRHPRFEREIVRSRVSSDEYQPFFGRPDWGYILDYLLTLDHPVVIKLRASAGGASGASVSFDAVHDEHSASDETAKSVLNEVLRRFSTTTETVSLRISVGSNREVSVPLLKLIGTEVAGMSTFDLATVEAVDLEPGRSRMLLAEGFGVFHAPYGEFFASRIGQRVTRLTSSVDSFPVTGIELGTAYRAHAKADRRIRVRLPESDALRHIYVIGRTGSGKTNFLRGLAEQHLFSPGTGLAVIDPHGDLAGHVLNTVPAARVDEVVTVDVTDPHSLPVLNPLAFDGTDAFIRSRVVQDVLELMKQRLYHEWSGPRFDEMVRLALDTMLDGGYPVAPALTDVPRILTDSGLQTGLIKRLRDPELAARWRFHQRLTTTREYPDLMDWVVSKFDDISRDESLRMVLGGERNTVDIDRVVRENGILIVRLPEAEVGRQAAELLGSLVLQQLRAALLRRTSSEAAGGHFFVYVDEFQKFATTAFSELVAEARKYGVGIVLAHQNLDQLKLFSPQSGQQDQGLLSAILGNVGSMVCFGVGAPDMDVMASQFAVRTSDVTGIGRHQALARLTLDGAWVPTMTLVTDLHDPELNPQRQDDIRAFQYKSERVLPRQEILRQLETRRAMLTEVGASETAERPPGEQPPADGVDTFMTTWRAKRAAARDAVSAQADAPAEASDERTVEQPVANDAQSHKETKEAIDSEPARAVSNGAGPPPAQRSAWADLVGPVVRLERVAEVLRESVETLRGRGELGRLLILRTRSGTEVIPASHFVDSRPLPGLSEVLEALQQTDWSPWSRAGWLMTPMGGLGGKSTIDWLRAGLDPQMPAIIASARGEDE